MAGTIASAANNCDLAGGRQEEHKTRVAIRRPFPLFHSPFPISSAEADKPVWAGNDRSKQNEKSNHFEVF
jgi:hypothetical protein